MSSCAPECRKAMGSLNEKMFVLYMFHSVHGVFKARILKLFAIPFSSGPRYVRMLHHDPSVLGGPTRHVS